MNWKDLEEASTKTLTLEVMDELIEKCKERAKRPSDFAVFIHPKEYNKLFPKKD